MPTTGSSDYFKPCSTHFDSLSNSYSFSVPQNYIGYQEALSGSGYAGYYANLSALNDNYYEYISVKLNHRLEKDKFYKLTYFLSLADSTWTLGRPLQFVNHSGAYFSSTITTASNDLHINNQPQVFSDSFF